MLPEGRLIVTSSNNSDGTTNLYGPGGLLTDERRLAWQCWAAFGNTELLREAGIIDSTQSC